MEDGWGVAVAFAPIDPGQSPNLQRPSLEPYHRSMVVAFSSVLRWNADLRLTLVTTRTPPQPYADHLTALGVTPLITPFSHQPPDGFTSRFAASLFQLDAMASSTTSTLFIDPDVLCIRSLAPLLDAVGPDRAGALPLDYATDHNVNGLSRREAEDIHVALGEQPGIPVHYGGECYAIPRALRGRLLERAESGWADSLDRWKGRRTHFVTEEHVLSYALRGVDVLTLESYVKRIWTAARVRNVTGDEYDLTLWHVPAEKDRGFSALYPDALDRTSWFWTAPDDAWRRRAARSLGLLNRTPPRLLRDAAGRTLSGLDNARSRLRR